MEQDLYLRFPFATLQFSGERNLLVTRAITALSVAYNGNVEMVATLPTDDYSSRVEPALVEKIESIFNDPLRFIDESSIIFQNFDILNITSIHFHVKSEYLRSTEFRKLMYYVALDFQENGGNWWQDCLPSVSPISPASILDEAIEKVEIKPQEIIMETKEIPSPAPTSKRRKIKQVSGQKSLFDYGRPEKKKDSVVTLK